MEGKGFFLLVNLALMGLIKHNEVKQTKPKQNMLRIMEAWIFLYGKQNFSATAQLQLLSSVHLEKSASRQCLLQMQDPTN